ncbi:MAG TPA: hypothetical protein VHR42_06990, partial [Clostridia bacterium]|nr:hypothetical protein [Clostridia bacterium]
RYFRPSSFRSLTVLNTRVKMPTSIGITVTRIAQSGTPAMLRSKTAERRKPEVTSTKISRTLCESRVRLFV